MRSSKLLTYVFTILLLVSFNLKAVASSESLLNITEINPNQLKGIYNGNGTLRIEKDGTAIATKTVQAGVPFTISFPTIRTTVLTITLKDRNGSVITKKLNYYPPKVDKVTDKSLKITGVASGSSSVAASINNQGLHLSSFDKTTGKFVFILPSSYQSGTKVRIKSNRNGIYSVGYVTVDPAPNPQKPIINTVSNKDTYITGTTEPNSTIYFLASDRTYTTKLGNSSTFKMTLYNNKALAAGTTYQAYVIDSRNRKSEILSGKVVDRIAPTLPKVDRITTLSLKISGTTEANAEIFMKKNGAVIKRIRTGSTGAFSFPLPLQSPGTKFEVYSVDSSGNKSQSSIQDVNVTARPTSKILSAPIVSQMPELPRGCEVTSLSMLLGHAEVQVSKMTLAQQVQKDTTPYRKVGGKIYFGNPHVGFVGNMYTFNKPGFGVFHKPIYNLASTYLPNRVVNLTGSSFDTIKNYIAAGKPVWIITTSWFRPVPSEYWQTWYTPTGTVRVTYKEHSVLVTGYDQNYVYFNDPLDGKKNKKKPIKEFIEAWKQYGTQAISYF